MSRIFSILVINCMFTVNFIHCFTSPRIRNPTSAFFSARADLSLRADKVAREVTGGELEVMLQEWDQPLILDAYATWCGPCLLMAPHFEEAAKELEGKVRFVKMDTDKEPDMANRLNIMGLPTIMFLDKLEPEEGDEGEPKAALKNKIEGAITKDSIVELCNFHFFDGPMPGPLE